MWASSLTPLEPSSWTLRCSYVSSINSVWVRHGAFVRMSCFGRCVLESCRTVEWNVIMCWPYTISNDPLYDTDQVLTHGEIWSLWWPSRDKPSDPRWTRPDNPPHLDQDNGAGTFESNFHETMRYNIRTLWHDEAMVRDDRQINIDIDTG